ncbi:MAG: LD-carboxypeptidase [Sphingobium sp. 32-64-5]|nr:MAG: LD-carboxypeptidase [Sphingobium sp. 32-64-5]
MFSRRSTISGIGGLIAGLALPHPARAETPARPPRLRAGDRVGLIEPAGFSDGPFEIEAVKSTIAGMGLVPITGQHVASRYGYLAGTDQDRAADINAMFADRNIRALFAMRGGWGCARLLPYLDWDIIRANPKLLIGFSDITALHLAFAAHAGFPSIHAPNAANSWRPVSWESFWRLAFAGETPTFLPPPPPSPPPAAQDIDPARPFTTIRPGKARGRLLGGNLSVLAALVGTPWLPDFSGAILFLEDVNEAEYRIDRMLSQLSLAGILRQLAGVAFGQCTRCTIDVPDYAGFTVPQLLDQYIRPLGIPAFQGANIGHISNQLSIPVGVGAEMDAEAGSLRILEPVVA